MANSRAASEDAPRFIQARPHTEIIEHGRTLHMYRVTDDELENLVSVGNNRTVDTAWGTGFLTAFVAFLTVVLTALPTDRVLGDFFVMMCVLSGLGAVFFFIRTVMAARRANRVISHIKQSG